MKINTLRSEYLNNHPYFKARKDAYQLASGKIVDPYFVVELPPSATAMAITAEGEVIMVSQYRHPIGAEILELPGGFIEENENPIEGIARELLEETGYQFNEIIPLGITAANPGLINNFTHLFLATGGVKVKAQELDHNEEIQLTLMPIEKVKSLLLQSEIKQSMHALCIFYALQKLQLMD
jgi:8-oxo-dGTP pyrophosphatase MutT (NUDIX family)